MQNIFRKFLPVVALFISSSLFAAPQDELNTADSLFKAGKYTQAFEKYESILTEVKMASPGMLLKMAYIKEGLGQVDQALYYLNLYYLKTTDDDVLSKMATLAKNNDMYGYEEDDFAHFISYYYKFYQEITFLLLALILLAFAMLIYQKRRGVNRPISSGVVLLFFIMILFYHANNGRNYGKAIINSEQTYVMSGPSAGSKVVDIISAGHRVEVQGHEDVWVKVEWNDEDAYIKNLNLKTIPFI